MCNPNRADACRLPCETAPKNGNLSPTLAKVLQNQKKSAPNLPEAFSAPPDPKQTRRVWLEGVLAVFFLLCGWVYVKMLFAPTLPVQGLIVFSLLYLLGVECYARLYRRTACPGNFLWFCVVAGLICSLVWSFFLQSLSGNFAFSSVLFGYRFLCLTLAAVYWTLSRLGALWEGKTGSCLPFDLLRGFISLPFGHFFARHRAFFGPFLQKKRAGRIGGVLAGVLLAALVIGYALPQLAAASPAFSNLVGGAWHRFWLWLDRFQLASFLLQLTAAVLVADYLFGLCHGAGEVCPNTPYAGSLQQFAKNARKLQTITLCILLFSICTLYLVFIGVQAGVLFSGWLGIRPAEYTYAKYARAGFFELCRLAGVNLALCAFCALCGKNRPAENRPLRYAIALLACLTLLLIASAAARMVLYISVYGFTPKRLLTCLALGILFFVFGLILLWLRRPLPIMKIAALVTAAVFTAAFLSGPEIWMEHYNCNLPEPSAAAFSSQTI